MIERDDTSQCQACGAEVVGLNAPYCSACLELGHFERSLLEGLRNLVQTVFLLADK